MSVVATLLDDPLRELIEFFVGLFANVYDGLGRMATPSGLEHEFETNEEDEEEA